MLARILKQTCRVISTTSKVSAPPSHLFVRRNRNKAKPKVVPRKDTRSTDALLEYHKLYELIGNIGANGTEIGELMVENEVTKEFQNEYDEEQMEEAKKHLVKPNPQHKAIQTAIDNAYKSFSFAFSLGGFWDFKKDVLQIKSADGTLVDCGSPIALSKEKILAHCAPAPFGDLKTMTTVVDPTVRSAWELDYDRVVITNENFPKDYQRKKIEEILAEVQQNFQDESLYLEPYKLNVYTKGGFFKPHKDTPRFENMIGTLVTVLNYCGSSLVVRHGKEEFVEDSSTTAFFSDRVHEITPIEDDMRVSLTFSICKESASVTKSPQAITHKRDTPLVKDCNIASLIKTIKKSPLKAIGILTEFDYTQKSISIQSLKGNDRAMFEALSKEPSFEVDLLPVIVKMYHSDNEMLDEFPVSYYESGSVYRFLTEDMDRMLRGDKPTYKDDIVFFWQEKGLGIHERRIEAAELVGNHSQPTEVDNIYFNGAIIVKNLNAVKTDKVKKNK